MKLEISGIRSISSSNDGTRIISGGADGTIKVWNSVTDKVINTFYGHSGWVHSVSFSNDGTRIVSGGADGTIKVWNSVTGKVIPTLTNNVVSSGLFLMLKYLIQ